MNISITQKNHHIRDERIQFFEEGHQYLIDGKKGYQSVTTMISKLFEPFDAVAISEKVFHNSRDSRTSKYKNMQSPEEIQNAWHQTSVLGTQLHYQIECFYNQELPSDVEVNHASLLKQYEETTTKHNSNVEWNHFIQFVKNYPDKIPYRSEWTVFNEDINVCGSIDMLFKNPEDDTYSIYDWKRTEMLSPMMNNYDKYAILPVLCHIPDTKYWHYAIQLNMYKYILETKYDKVVRDLALVKLHPSGDNYEIQLIPDLKEDILDLVDMLVEDNKTKEYIIE